MGRLSAGVPPTPGVRWRALDRTNCPLRSVRKFTRILNCHLAFLGQHRNRLRVFGGCPYCTPELLGQRYEGGRVGTCGPPLRNDKRLQVGGKGEETRSQVRGEGGRSRAPVVERALPRCAILSTDVVMNEGHFIHLISRLGVSSSLKIISQRDTLLTGPQHLVHPQVRVSSA